MAPPDSNLAQPRQPSRIVCAGQWHRYAGDDLGCDRGESEGTLV